MSNKKPLKFLSLTLCLILLATSVSYADTVVIGVAPSASSAKAVTGMATTTYLTNSYTGPGTTPTSATTGTTPLQGLVSIDQSAGQKASQVDNNNVSDSGPTTKTISSPAAHNAELGSTQSAVITNGASYKGSGSDNTADKGPTTTEISAPTADGTSGSSSGTVIVNGQEVNQNGPGYSVANTGTTTTTTTGGGIPSYSTGTSTSGYATITLGGGGTALNTDSIIYQCNNNIQAVKPAISAPGALAVNATSKQIYFSKGGFTQFYPTGLTTLVTGSILLSYKKLDDVLTVSATAVTGLESGAITAGLQAGDTIKVRDALGAMYVRSCCDVANVVAENVAGSIPNFVSLMNQTVKNWGCVGTNFTNPTGLNSTSQLTNTYDAAIIMDKATSNPSLKIMLQQTSYTLPATAHRGAKKLTSTNKILTSYAGSASRLGYTSKAKYCAATSIDYNGSKLIAVVLKANNTHVADTTKLLNFAKVASIEAASSGYTAAAITTTNVQVSTNAGDTQGTWLQDNKGWYFLKSNGMRANNEWIKQNGKMYCVDSTGYMITGWREMTNGKMYYFDPTNGEFKYNTWVNVSGGAYYLQADGSLAKADYGTTKNIVTAVGTYTIDQNGKAIAKVS